jgi:excisionase family DNA binding protein
MPGSAAVAQLVERKLPKLEVASSNLVRRFYFIEPNVALLQGFGGRGSRAGRGQARASAGKKVTNLLPPCCHGIGLPQTTGAQLVDGRGPSPYASRGRSLGWEPASASRWLPDGAAGSPGLGWSIWLALESRGVRERWERRKVRRGRRAALSDRRTMGTARTPRPKVRLLTTREAAAALGVHERTLRRYIASGLLACRRLPGGHYRIPEAAIVDLWDEGDDAGRRGRRRAPAAQRPSPGGSSVDSQASARPPCHPRQADEGATVAYDLSLEALAALRSQVGGE